MLAEISPASSESSTDLAEQIERAVLQVTPVKSRLDER